MRHNPARGIMTKLVGNRRRVRFPVAEGLAMAQEWRIPAGHALRRLRRGVFGFVLIG